ncbi:MAG: cytochrome P450 [Acidimicrobiales bacterium]
MRREEVMIPLLRGLVSRPRLTALAFSRDPWGNPFADDIVADPSPYIARMWEDGPVSFSKTFRRWFVIGYDECQLLANHLDAGIGPFLDTVLDDVRPYRNLAPETKEFFRNWMLSRDGEEHARLRKLVNRTFTPRCVAEQEPFVEAAVDELLNQIGDRPRVEMVAAFNRPLPVTVIGRMLGVPTEDTSWISEIVAAMSTFFDPFSKFDADLVDGAVADFRRYVLDLAQLRIEQPQDDLITALAQAEEDGDRLSEDELVANLGLLVFAGHDTTTYMLGNALIALAAHPEQRSLVRSEPELWPNAIEELLRYDTTAVAVSRETTEEIQVGATTIPAGAPIILQLNAANRDPRRWDDAYELQLDRTDPRPLSFGHGAHHCLGHALARMELRVALRAVIERFGDYTIDHVDWRLSPTLRGPTTLTLTRQ